MEDEIPAWRNWAAPCTPVVYETEVTSLLCSSLYVRNRGADQDDAISRARFNHIEADGIWRWVIVNGLD
jgi:hypothetical protein